MFAHVDGQAVLQWWGSLPAERLDNFAVRLAVSLCKCKFALVKLSDCDGAGPFSRSSLSMGVRGGRRTLGWCAAGPLDQRGDYGW